jgi:hypothetical protein
VKEAITPLARESKYGWTRNGYRGFCLNADNVADIGQTTKADARLWTYTVLRVL